MGIRVPRPKAHLPFDPPKVRDLARSRPWYPEEKRVGDQKMEAALRMALEADPSLLRGVREVWVHPAQTTGQGLYKDMVESPWNPKRESLTVARGVMETDAVKALMEALAMKRDPQLRPGPRLEIEGRVGANRVRDLYADQPTIPGVNTRQLVADQVDYEGLLDFMRETGEPPIPPERYGAPAPPPPQREMLPWSPQEELDNAMIGGSPWGPAFDALSPESQSWLRRHHGESMPTRRQWWRGGIPLVGDR